MKAIVHWLEMLDSPYKEKALSYLYERPLYVRWMETNSMHKALFSAFKWNNTEEGYRFWSLLAHSYKSYSKYLKNGDKGQIISNI